VAPSGLKLHADGSKAKRSRPSAQFSLPAGRIASPLHRKAAEHSPGLARRFRPSRGAQGPKRSGWGHGRPGWASPSKLKASQRRKLVSSSLLGRGVFAVDAPRPAPRAPKPPGQGIGDGGGCCVGARRAGPQTAAPSPALAPAAVVAAGCASSPLIAGPCLGAYRADRQARGRSIDCLTWRPSAPSRQS